jgi:hypothetical protein
MHAEPTRILPISFSGPMVLALQDRCKTVTRRLSSSPLARLQPGDLLWVREAIRISGIKVTPGRLVFSYEADGREREVPWPKRLAKPLPGPRIPRFMPREISRLTLRVVHVHTELLHQIEDRECYDEGIGATQHLEAAGGDPRRAFSVLWDELHDKPGERWADNPEVVAIRFACMRQGVDALIPGLGHGGVR